MGTKDLKDFKLVWRDACHTMWAELTSLRCASALIHQQYTNLSATRPLTSSIFAPECRGRLDDVTPDIFLERMPQYQTSIVTSRVVLLSAAFELYFGNFLDAYLLTRSKFTDATGGALNPEGSKILGEVRKVRGIAERIEEFGKLTAAKLNSVRPHLQALRDVYMLRNVIAHRAGQIDKHAADSVKTFRLHPDTRIALSPPELLKLATPVVTLAEELDAKISVGSAQQTAARDRVKKRGA